MRSANGVGLLVIQSSHQLCRLPMLMEVVFVITAGALGLGFAAPEAMLGAALEFGRAVVIAVGAGVCIGAVVAAAVALAFADALALARGDVEGDGRGAAGAGNTGGSTNGDSMRRSTVRANPSDSARSSSTSFAPKDARRRRCVTLALSLTSGETQSTSPASFGAAMPLIGGCSATAGRTFTGGSAAGFVSGTSDASRSCGPR